MGFVWRQSQGLVWGGGEIGVLMPYDGMGDGEARPKHHPCGWNESVQRKNTPSIPTAL